MNPPADRAIVAACTVAIETSTRRGSVALRAADGAVVERVLEGARAHASDLLPALDALRAEHPGAVTTVVVGTGPGSYTGLRVGVASALGLARGWSSTLRGVPSSEALAFAELQAGETCTILADARGGRVYCARYGRTADDVDVLAPPAALPFAELRTLALEDDLLLCDESVTRELEALGRGEERVRVGHSPTAVAVLTLGSNRLATHGPQEPAEVRPLYLADFAPRG